jgi:3-hydroxyisobutyrate dehydrogenase-like beta-hydroxyacid dehydrogenase
MHRSPIGLIGVGLLGTALAERMLAGGLEIIGLDRERRQLDRLTQLGGSTASDARQIAAQCEQIVLCLPDSAIVGTVVQEMAGNLRPAALLIDATTGDPDDAEQLALRLGAEGIGYVDATLAGSSEQVRRGDATVIIGGAAECVRRAGPVLATWSASRFHVGPAGSGARLKLVVNLVLGLNRAVLAEGLSLAQACGIEPAAALSVLQATPAYSRVMEAKGPKMIARDYAPQARLAQHAKDVRLIRELARRHGGRTPLSDLHAQLLQQAIELGFGEADNSAVIEAYRAGQQNEM